MTQNSLQIITSAVSDRGLSEKRPQNEDSYLEMPDQGLFAVADGVGGAQAGDVASQMSVEILAEAFYNWKENGDVEERMSVAITRANSAIYQTSHDLPQLSTMATTVVALQITGNIATIGHVGDSRLYRLDSRGNLFRETQDHSVVEEEVRAGRMTLEQAENHPSKNVISRALGAEGTVEIDMKTIMFEPNTSFLLCSDGITRHISDNEIRELLSLSHHPSIICSEMKDICYERGAEDNLTAVIIRIVGQPEINSDHLDETTTATTRPQISEDMGSLQSQYHYQESQTQPLVAPQITQRIADAFPEDEAPTFQLPVRENLNATPSAPIQIAEKESFVSPVEFETQIERDEKTYTIDGHKTGGNGFLKFLLGLILGGLLGIAGYYFWLTNQLKEETPVISQMQSADIPYSAFENLRRTVDRNPSQFIASSNGTGTDSEDFYLLGRAQLLLGKYAEASANFNKAKELLKIYSGENKEILKNEIMVARAAIFEPQSKEFIQNELNDRGEIKDAGVNTAAPSNASAEKPKDANKH